MTRSGSVAAVLGLAGAWAGIGGASGAPGVPPVVSARPGPSQRPGAVTAFVDVAVIPMDQERVLAHQTVVVQHDRIVALGPTTAVRVPRRAVRVDGRGQFLIPGLGDMHTHLAYSGPAHVERHLLLLLASGVTTVRNMDFHSALAAAGEYQPFANSPPLDGPALLQLKARVASGEVLGPRIYTSAAWRTDTTTSIDANVAAYQAAGYDHLKWYWEDSVTTDSLAAAAHRYGVPLVGHGATMLPGRGFARTLALGFTSIEHAVPYASEDSAKLRDEVAATVRAGVWNCLGPMIRGLEPSPLERRYAAAELRLLFGTEPDTSTLSIYTATPAALASGGSQPPPNWLEIVAKALHAGGATKLLLGTDMLGTWGGMPLPMALHRALQKLVRFGFTPYEALTLVTRNVAEYFGTVDSTGTVAVGKRADLVLLTGNPLVDIRHVNDIAGVMIGGRWLPHTELERRLNAYYHGESRQGGSKVGR